MILRTRYATEQRALVDKDASDSAQQRLADRYATIEALYDGFAADGPHEFIDLIKELFNDDRAATITASSVHKAKGLENTTVAILQPEKMPLFFRDAIPSPEQLRQENNVINVAFTRSQDKLVLVPGEEKDG